MNEFASKRNLLTGNKVRWIAAALAAFATGHAAAQPYGYDTRVGNGYNRPARIVHCESNNWNRNFCPIAIRRADQVRVVRQYSERPCIEGRNWNVDQRGIWVTDGCRADFAVVRRPPAAGNAYVRNGDRGNRSRDDGDQDGPPHGSFDRYQDRPVPGAYNRYQYRPAPGTGDSSARAGGRDDDRQGAYDPRMNNADDDRQGPPPGAYVPRDQRGQVTVRDPDGQQNDDDRSDMDGDPSDRGMDGDDQSYDPNQQRR